MSTTCYEREVACPTLTWLLSCRLEWGDRTKALAVITDETTLGMPVKETEQNITGARVPQTSLLKNRDASRLLKCVEK